MASSSNTGRNTRSKNVNLVVPSSASLLSGGLDDCQTYDDESCKGGIAAISAYARNLTNDEPFLIIPAFDKESQFVQVHPMGWSVNRVVYEGQFGLKLFIAAPSLLLQNKKDYNVSTNDLSELQSLNMPLLLTNAYIPPSISWYQYAEAIHFDSSTGLAVMSLYNSGEPLSWPHIESARGSLNFIADRNEMSGCTNKISQFDKYFVHVDLDGSSAGKASQGDPTCWIPVIVFIDWNPPAFEEFVSSIVEHENPPAVIVDLEGNNENYTKPTKIRGSETSSNDGTWVVSYWMSDEVYYQHRFTLSKDYKRVENITTVLADLEALPTDLKDAQYAKDISFLRKLADEAQANNPVVGFSSYMPVAREGTYKRCQGGECEIGNLFADSLRWKSESDIAFVTSGGFRGVGWSEGEVHLASIWEALPFPNSICTGTMSGVSLLKLLDYSINVATFHSEGTSEGGRLLQVSGLKVTYNTQLQGSRLISVDVWDSNEKRYAPVERLGLYTFATDSYVCSGYTPFPELLGHNNSFIIEGEVPAKKGNYIVQNVVAEYLSELQQPYNASNTERLINNTNALVSLNFLQSEEDCETNTYWVENKLTCFPCPNSSHISFAEPRQEFVSVERSTEQHIGRAILVNREIYNFSVFPRAIPSWLRIIGNSRNATTSLTVNAEPMLLQPGDSVAFDFVVGDNNLQAGTALGTVSFGLLGDDRNFPGCQYSHGTDFDVFLKVLPGQKLNQLGPIRFLGLALMGLTMSITIFFAVWVAMRRKSRIISTMQPFFLVSICCGVLIIETTIIPLSIDDGLAGIKACHVACTFIPWLISMGSTVTFSALFSKLWRINQLFNADRFRKKKITEKDVSGPPTALFLLNLALLVAWTVADPWHFKRLSVPSEEWNTYGVCKSRGVVGNTILSTIAGLNVSVLFLTCFQAYKARGISADFSVARKLFFALYTILQVIVVGLPVLLLIDEDNIAARYFIMVGLIFTICMSMMLLLFLPIFMNLREFEQSSNSNTVAQGSRRTHVTGVAGLESASYNPSNQSHTVVETSTKVPTQFQLH